MYPRSSVGPCVIPCQMFVKSEFPLDSALVSDSDFFKCGWHFFSQPLKCSNEGWKEGRKEGTCLFDINNHNTEYTTVKLCRETPTKAQSVPLSREPPTCHNT